MDSTCENFVNRDTVLLPLGFHRQVGDQIRTFSGLEAKLLASGDRVTVNFSPWYITFM